MIETSISADRGWPADTDWEALARRATDAAIAHSDWSGLAVAAPVIEIAVRLASDEDVRILNRDYRNRDMPTNVLSFPMLSAPEIAGLETSPVPEALLGDIVLAHGVCAREAAEKGVTLAAHASHLIVHGVLHLLGYDHGDDAEAEPMEAIETAAMDALGLDRPYDG